MRNGGTSEKKWQLHILTLFYTLTQWRQSHFLALWSLDEQKNNVVANARVRREEAGRRRFERWLSSPPKHGFDTKEIKKYKFTNLLTRCDTQFAFCNWFLALLALGPTGCGILEVVGRAFDYCVHGGCCEMLCRGDDSECDMIGAPPLLFIRDVSLFQRSWRLHNAA